MNHPFSISSFSEKIFLIPIDLYFENKKINKEKIMDKYTLINFELNSSKSSNSEISEDENKEKRKINKKKLLFTKVLNENWELKIKNLKKSNLCKV
jgi:hypothetical protein